MRQRGSIAIELVAGLLLMALIGGFWIRHDMRVKQAGVNVQLARDAEENARLAKFNEGKAARGEEDAKAAATRADSRRIATQRQAEKDRLARQAGDELRMRDPSYAACVSAPACAGDALRLREHAARVQGAAGGDQLPAKLSVQGGPPQGFPRTTPGKLDVP